jgi:rsbT co-antagonist protein RsbR
MNSDQMADEQLLDSVADALLALTNVGLGDYDTRLKVDPDDRGALASLFSGINEMIASLGAEQEKSRAYQRELEEKLDTIEKQRAAIRDLSTPILEVWDGVLCLPVVGVMDTARSTEMTASLLQAVTEKGSHATIIDITGIDVMDTRTVDHFIRMARSVRLLGAECALTGMRPYIAQTVVQMGIDLANVVTYRSLREALQYYVTRNRL